MFSVKFIQALEPSRVAYYRPELGITIYDADYDTAQYLEYDTKIPVIFFHGGCLDGLTAAAVCVAGLAQLHDQVIVRSCNYDDDHKTITQNLCLAADREVFMVDFSYKAQEMELLAERAMHLVWMDHHESAKNILQDKIYENVTRIFSVDNSSSGAGLAYRFFAGSEEETEGTYITSDLVRLVQAVEDRDLWRFQYPSTKAICAAMYMQAKHVGDVFAVNVHDLALAGKYLLEQQADQVEQCCKSVIVNRLDTPERPDIECVFVNAPAFLASEIGNKLSKKYPAACIYQVLGDKVRLSFRSSKENPEAADCTKLAALANGGGHVNAAGATIHLSQLMPWLGVYN